MNRLLEIQGKLLDTNAALAQLERAIAENPESSALAAMAKSLEKRYRSLEADFLAEVDSLGIDVCSYRLFGEDTRPSIKALSNVLADFQNLVTSVYDAIKTRVPKLRARPSPEIAAETEFRFGYTFPGSIGVVLTLPNQRRLFGESELDESVRLVFEMAGAQESSHILQYAKRLGPASVRALYKWAYDHAESGLGANIEWRRGQDIRAQLLAQWPELRRLHRTINVTSEESTSELKVEATLEGADVPRRTFHVKRLDTGEDIRGTFTDAISSEHTVELPKRYTVHLVKTERILYSTEQEITSYHLRELEPLP